MFSRTLKAETQYLHHQLDNHPTLSSLLKPISPDIYQDVLSVLYGYYKPLEATFALYEQTDTMQQLSWSALRYKSDRLYRDLCQMDVDLVNSAWCHELPNIQSEASLIGVLYVLEGATLGGQVIKRHLNNNPHLQHLPKTFFDGYGKATGQMWQTYQTVLQTFYERNQQDAPIIIEAAKTTFTTLFNWLEHENNVIHMES